METVNIQAEERVYSVGECGYTYRNSIFKRSENKSAFVTYVRFRLSKEEHYTAWKISVVDTFCCPESDYCYSREQAARSESDG